MCAGSHRELHRPWCPLPAGPCPLAQGRRADALPDAGAGAGRQGHCFCLHGDGSPRQDRAQAATELARATGDLCWFALRASASACVASLLWQARRAQSPATASGTRQAEATSPAPSADRPEAGVPASGRARYAAFARATQKLPQDAPHVAAPETLRDAPSALPLTTGHLKGHPLATPKATPQSARLCALPATRPDASPAVRPAAGPCGCPAPAMLPAGAEHAYHSAQAAHAGTACQKHAQGPATAAHVPLQALPAPQTASTPQTVPSPRRGPVPLAKLTKAKPAFRPPGADDDPEAREIRHDLTLLAGIGEGGQAVLTSSGGRLPACVPAWNPHGRLPDGARSGPPYACGARPRRRRPKESPRRPAPAMRLRRRPAMSALFARRQGRAGGSLA